MSKLRHLMTPGLIVGLLAAATAPASADAPPRPAAKDALTADHMQALHRLICPRPGEYRWDEVPWYASIWHARKAAAEQDKPILVFGTGGAGFNDPLGNC